MRTTRDTTTVAPTRSARPPPISVSGPTSHTSPSKPSNRPATTRPVGRTPPGRSQSSNTMKQGTVPTSSAATPDGMRCSDHTSRPLPPSRSSTPTTAVARQCARVGAAAPFTRRDQRVEHRAGDDEARAGHQKRRQRLDREQDREKGRAPDDVDDRERGRQREPGRRCGGLGAHGRAAVATSSGRAARILQLATPAASSGFVSRRISRIALRSARAQVREVLARVGDRSAPRSSVAKTCSWHRRAARRTPASR